MKTPRTRRLQRTVVFAVAAALITLMLAASASAAVRTHPKSVVVRTQPSPAGKWLSSDLNTHTYLTDGKNTQDEVIRNAYEVFGLDGLANSEPGGQFSTVPSGLTSFASPVWRWMTLTNYSFPLILDARSLYPDKETLQGVEWNAPAHGTASVGIVGAGNEPYGIGTFEYRFDAKDTDTSRAGEAQKEISHTETDTAGNLVKVVDIPAVSMDKTNTTGADMLSAVQYLDNTYSLDAYAIINNPSRSQLWHVGDFRALNDAAPDIAFGMEGIPGRQPFLAGRGDYTQTFSDPAVQERARTYGGADWMVAKVGGLWDSLLGEGRNWWIFTDSNYHRYTQTYNDAAGNYYGMQWNDFWPGQYNQTFCYATEATNEGLVNADRSGDVFVSEGHLISALNFRVVNGKQTATMGQTLSVAKGKTVTVSVAFQSPQMNDNGDQPKVDHVDLIAGDVTGPIDPSSPDYTAKETNSSTKVITSFKTFKAKNGWLTASFKVPVTGSMYFRLRGTNLPPSTPNETDVSGNPLQDTLSYVDVPQPDPTKVATQPTIHGNTPDLAWGDLWFYSNPIYISAP
jgi:hypothetical protein